MSIPPSDTWVTKRLPSLPPLRLATYQDSATGETVLVPESSRPRTKSATVGSAVSLGATVRPSRKVR